MNKSRNSILATSVMAMLYGTPRVPDKPESIKLKPLVPDPMRYGVPNEDDRIPFHNKRKPSRAQRKALNQKSH